MFIPLYSTSLAHIYGKFELILPVKYLPNRIEDIQNIYPNHILLSKHKWIKECRVFASENIGMNKITNCDVSIELNEIDEKDLIKLDDNFYLCDKPILLSKVKYIWFLSKGQMDTSIGNIEITQGFVPEHLLKIDKNPQFVKFNKPKKRIPKPKDFSKKLTLYNKYLGAIILTRNLLGKKNFLQVIENTLSKINKQLKKDIFNTGIEKEEVEKIANMENIKIKSFGNIIVRDPIPKDSLTYIYVMLYTYKPFMNDNIEGLLEDMQEHVSKEKLEETIILYGILAGYNKLNLKVYVEDKIFFNRFKFENDDLDIIESVYKTVFKEKISRKERLIEIGKMDLDQINIPELAQKYQVSEQTIRKDIREVFKIGKMRIEKYIKLKKLKQLLTESKLSTQDISEKLAISKNTTRKYLKELEANKKREGRIILYSL